MGIICLKSFHKLQFVFFLLRKKDEMFQGRSSIFCLDCFLIDLSLYLTVDQTILAAHVGNMRALPSLNNKTGAI